jgi:hypothetical protein
LRSIGQIASLQTIQDNDEDYRRQRGGGNYFAGHDRRRLPGAVARRQDRRRLGLRPVKPHHEVDLAVRRRQPVGLFVDAR